MSLSSCEQVAQHQDLCKNTLSASILELVARSDRKRNRKNANFVISYLSLSMYEYNLSLPMCKYNLSLFVQIHLVSLDSRTLGEVWEEEEGKKECKGREGVGKGDGEE